MCTVCGCNDTQGHKHEAGQVHYGKGEAGTSVAGMSQQRLIQIETDILGKNNSHADRNRSVFSKNGILALNLVSSPGSGKTTLLVETLKRLSGKAPASVIEGDQQTSNDADRIRKTGAAAVQINTGKGCHLDAHMVGHALEKLPLDPGSILFIENVGNLVCPAGFDLGEAVRVVILSVTEGEDKPLKYPDIFASADLVILNKTDLLPHLDFNVEQAIAHAKRVNRKIEVIQMSAKTCEGFDDWLGWLEDARERQALRDCQTKAAE